MESKLDFGVDWYPEQWDESIWKSDVQRIAEAGFTIVRIMDFAWSILEPEPEHFDFSLFDKAIELLAFYNIKVIVCTPTAAPPRWLIPSSSVNSNIYRTQETNTDPVLRQCSTGQQHDFGTRRNCCFNSDIYNKAAMRIASAIGEHYGKDDRVIGFQIDNEIGHEGSDRCVCPNCVKAWHVWLSNKYEQIEKLNKEWGTVFWNTTYKSFEEISIPVIQPGTRHNPTLLLDYDRFCSDSASNFTQNQTHIIEKFKSNNQFITTNLFPPPLSNAIDMAQMTKDMDFASWDNYPVWGDQDEAMPWQFNALAQAFVRGLHNNKPITIMEEICGFQGHVCLGYLPPERRLGLWAAQAIARGANRVLFFRWRTAPYAQEQLCYGMIDTDNEETERLRVLCQMIKRAKTELSCIASSKVESPVCACYSKDDGRLLREQFLSKGLEMRVSPLVQAGVDREMALWYAPYVTLGVNADVCSIDTVNLEDYKIIALPLYQMANPEIVNKLEEWVKNGGRLVLSYRTGTRDLRNWNVSSPLPGLFRKLAGIKIPRFESLNTGSAKLKIGLFPAKGNVWADIIEAESAEVVARWADNKKFYSGNAAITKNKFGKGTVWYIGTSLDSLGMILVYRKILKEAGIKTEFHGANIEAITRTDINGKSYKLLLNHSPKPKNIKGTHLEAWDWNIS